MSGIYPPSPAREATGPCVLTRFQPVETALKDCAGLSVREFALIVIDESGGEKTYTSTSLTPHQQRIFTDRFRTDFRRSVRRAATGGSYPSLEEAPY
jgi:hypothetical protein